MGNQNNKTRITLPKIKNNANLPLVFSFAQKINKS